MNREDIPGYILDGIPYELVFVDCDHVIRHLNRIARKKFGDIVGKSIFDFHKPSTNELLKRHFAQLERDGKEIFTYVNGDNVRVYVTPVHDEQGNLLGYFQRFEKNTAVKSSHKEAKS